MIKNVNHNHKFSSILLFRCVEADLCDDDREKTNINPFSSISHSNGGNEDILNTLIASAQNAKCTEKGARCCSTKFITPKGTGYINCFVRKESLLEIDHGHQKYSRLR